MEFEIPSPGLYVVTGKNGSGKTTLFTCLSRICNRNAFRMGFPTTQGNNKLDCFSGYIEYEVDDSSVRYSKHPSGKWLPSKQGKVFSLMGYPEVKNITTKDERLFTQTDINPRRSNQDDTWLNQKLNEILGTEKFSQMIRITTGPLYRGRAKTNVESERRCIAYAIPLGSDKYYTERNFSFGEIVLLNLLYDIHIVTDGSLVLIDELELALHPSAQVRLLTCLKEMARKKGLTILITTHSASIIRSEKSVILLEDVADGKIDVLYSCPPAKAIGAIGMREDTMPDIVVLVEDEMAKALFKELKQKYISLESQYSYLDIRVLAIGGYRNVINFYCEAVNYVFYQNVFVTAFMDKDVETDIIPYPQYGNRKLIDQYTNNCRYLKFLPYTPEVFLFETLENKKRELLASMRLHYSNQQLSYTLTDAVDLGTYKAAFPEFQSQTAYNSFIERRSTIRSKCKDVAESAATEMANALKITVNEVYRYIFQFAVQNLSESDLNIRAYLAQTIKRLR